MLIVDILARRWYSGFFIAWAGGLVVSTLALGGVGCGSTANGILAGLAGYTVGSGQNDGVDVAGPTGDDGSDGLNCWDLNGDGVFNIETEDFDGDEIATVWDCRGLPGADGSNGRDGSDGADGVDGTPGGVQGPVGPPGPPGEDGVDGSDGVDGVDGVDGEDGQDAGPPHGRGGGNGPG